MEEREREEDIERGGPRVSYVVSRYSRYQIACYVDAMFITGSARVSGYVSEHLKHYDSLMLSWRIRASRLLALSYVRFTSSVRRFCLPPSTYYSSLHAT